MQKIAISEASSDDIDAILATSRITQNEHWQRMPNLFSPHLNEALYRTHFATGGDGGRLLNTHLIVCRDADNVVGRTMILLDSPAWDDVREDRRATIFDISLRPDYRGKGLGLQMMARAEEIMRKDGVTLARANVWNNNPASSALFARSGYEISGTTLSRRFTEPTSKSPNGLPHPKKWGPRLYLMSIGLNLFLIVWIIAFVNR